MTLLPESGMAVLFTCANGAWAVRAAAWGSSQRQPHGGYDNADELMNEGDA